MTSNVATKAIDNLGRKVTGQGAVRAWREFTFFISNDMDDILKIVESLEKSGLLMDSASETVKHRIKKQKGGFLSAMIAPINAWTIASMASLLIKPVAFSLINAITGNGVRRARKWQGGISPWNTILLMVKVMEKGVMDQHF